MVTAFFVPGERHSVLGLTYPHRADLAATLNCAVWVEDKSRKLRYRIPSLEAALANKYGAMLTPTRDFEKRLLDMVDFRLMIRHSLDPGRRPINAKKLGSLGDLVWPGGGGAEILGLVELVKAGKPTHVESLGGRPMEGGALHS